MHARLMRLLAVPTEEDRSSSVLAFLEPLLECQDGYRGCVIFCNRQNSEFCSLTLWESEAAAEASMQLLQPLVMKLLRGMYQTPPSFEHFELLKPPSFDTQTEFHRDY